MPQNTGNSKVQNPDNVQELGALSTSEDTITRLGRILRAQDKSSTPKRGTEHGERKLPWHSTSRQTPLNEDSMTSSPSARPLSQKSEHTGEARQAPYYCCSCLRAVTPECGAWTRASGLWSLPKEEKPESRARRAPAHMKRERGPRERERGRE